MKSADLDLLTRLRDSYSSLSNAQQRIADYIGEHLDDVMFLTAAQLAERIGVSESSMIRFTQGIGFAGYPEFRRELRAQFREQIRYAQAISERGKHLPPGPRLISDVAQFDISLIQETVAQLDPIVLERTVERILSANQVYVTGHRASYALAELFAISLQQGFGVGIPLVFGSGMVYDIIAAATSQDAIVAVSITPYSQQTLDLLTAASTQGMHRIVITDHPLGAPARLADEVIVFETAFHGVGSSYAGVMTIFRILLAMALRRDPDRVERITQRARELRMLFGTVHTEGDRR